MSARTRWARLGLVALAFVACGKGDSASPSEPEKGEGALPATLSAKIVFVRALGRTNVLMAMNPDGGDPVSLQIEGYHPHVSPDGRRVVYATPGEGIGLLDLVTGRSSELSGRLAVRPRWSPDGRRILFWSDRTGSNELWTMNPDGTGAVRLSDGGGGYHEGDWSPDGSRIVFRRVTGDGGDLWIMNADGTGARVLYAGERMDSDPRWSPDGRRIAFVRQVPRQAGTGFTSQIFVIDADGSNLVRVTRHDGQDWAPAWSPDGGVIAFFGYRSGPDDPDLFTVRPDGTGLTPLLDGPTYDHGPAYGPRP